MSKTNNIKHTTMKKTSKLTSKKRFQWVGIVLIASICIFVMFWGYRLFFQLPREKQAELEIEYKTIAVLPNASLVSYNASNKPVQSHVDGKYITNINPDNIFKYYDEQLKQHGWHPAGVRKVKDWDRDLGGKAADYCKGEYGVELFYAGEQANYGWTYSFDVNWGSNLNDCK